MGLSLPEKALTDHFCHALKLMLCYLAAGSRERWSPWRKAQEQAALLYWLRSGEGRQNQYHHVQAPAEPFSDCLLQNPVVEGSL